ncbi:hypothetical protein HNQ94_000955 [Salirhabdus euzebyi]|uniref:Uncharacterized protein n=1 Tax=Salirhabdus euzebyi TaxID=394506 RepID=A0A841PUM6_9BACI|nr:hypothetical protein [Salirhabdus euzebyi]
MIIFVFVLIHIMTGLVFLYFRGKLPKPLTTFGIIVLVMNFLYFGSLFISLS